MDKPTIEAKIAELKERRAKFIADANANVTFLNGKIEGLEELIAPPAEPEELIAEEPETPSGSVDVLNREED